MANFSSTYPSTRPVFNADFSNAGRLDSRITFSRSDTPPTYAAPSAVHYWSNEKHLSSENLIPNSNTNAAWQTFDVTKSVSGSFLDGSDSLLVSETANTAIHYISPNVGAGNSTSFVSGTEYTAVMYAKAGTDNIIQVGMTSGAFGANAYANYDLSNAATPPVTGSSATATITALGSDWVKLTLTATATSSATGTGMFVAFTDNNINAGRAPGYAGDTAANVYLWEGNVSSTGQKHLVETNGQIHREYAPTLKSVSTAGQPRFEYSPTDSASEAIGSSRGLLIEGSSTQLLTYSSDMSNVAWTKIGVTASAEAIGPDGTLSAVAVREDTGTSSHFIRQSVTLNGTAATFSVYAKILGNARRLVIREDAQTGSAAVFDLTTGTVASEVAGGTGTITPVGNGWYRCTMLCAPSSGSRLCSFWVVSNTALNYETTTGDGYSGLLLAMPQAEQQSWASSWISSTSSTVSRASDSAAMVDANLFDTGSGAIICELGPVAGTVYPTAFALTDSSTQNIVRCQGNNGATQMSLVVNSDNSGVATITQSFTPTGTKLAVSYDTNSFKLCTDGGTVGSDTAGQVPEGLNRLEIGGDTYSSSSLSGHVKRIALYGEALSDTNLQALTS